MSGLQMAVWMDRRSLSANEDHPVHRMAGEVGSTTWAAFLSGLTPNIAIFILFFSIIVSVHIIYFVAGDLHVSVSLES